MIKHNYLLSLSVVLMSLISGAAVYCQSVEPDQIPAFPPGIASEDMVSRATPDQRVRQYLLPKRILWQTEQGIKNADLLLQPVLGQTSTSDMDGGVFMERSGEEPVGILLDFGAEFHGGIRLEARNLTPGKNSVGRTVRVRVRFGESADEAMAEIEEKGAVSEHSVRDMIVNIPWLGEIEFGESAFRFVRIDLVDPGTSIHLDSIRAVVVYRDLPWLGSFKSSDEHLNAIWTAAAHTLHMTMQGYVFEGAKRDRLVWYGDINPQAMSALRVFGDTKVLRDTLGYYARETWPLPKWMNTMPNYSLWWLISISDFYRHTANLAFLQEQHEYMKGLVDQLIPYIGEDGRAGFPNPFLDWPTNGNRPALDAGTHAMFAIAFERIIEMAQALKDSELEKTATVYLKKIRSFKPENVDNKQAASLLAIAGLENEKTPNIPVVVKNGGENFSTFYGYYMLEALAIGNQKQVALDVIREYWGAMIDVGATTFWEDFDLKWLEGSGRIDELTPKGMKSLHGDHGAYCYVGFRHSLCHGWASGPAAWMSEYLLGAQPTSPGFKTMEITPFLGDLDWVEGDVPTPWGSVHIRHEKKADGTIDTTVNAPDEVQWTIKK